MILFCLSHSVSDAKAYVDFILNSIRKKDLFHSIEIKPESCWEYLMWMDQVKKELDHAIIYDPLIQHSIDISNDTWSTLILIL